MRRVERISTTSKSKRSFGKRGAARHFGTAEHTVPKPRLDAGNLKAARRHRAASSLRRLQLVRLTPQKGGDLQFALIQPGITWNRPTMCVEIASARLVSATIIRSLGRRIGTARGWRKRAMNGRLL